MAELMQTTLPDLAVRARELGAALDLDEGALGAMLFGMVTRLMRCWPSRKWPPAAM